MKLGEMSMKVWCAVLVSLVIAASARALPLEKDTPKKQLGIVQLIEPAKSKLTDVPVPVRIRLGSAADTKTLRVWLNGKEVSSLFTLNGREASAELKLVDGLKVKYFKDKPRYAQNKLKVQVTDTKKLRKSQISGHFFLGLPESPSGVTAVIPPEGGQIVFPSVATVSFPQGAFLQPQSVELLTTEDPLTAANFEETSILFSPSNRLTYELRIRSGSSQPLTDFNVAFELPASFLAAVMNDSEIRVFGQNYWDSGDSEVLDTFELFPERFLPADTNFNVILPPWLFTDKRTADGSFEAIITLATTPTRPALVLAAAQPYRSVGGIPEVHVQGPSDSYYFAGTERNDYARFLVAAGGDTCDGTTLSPPLDGNLEVTSPFGPRDPSIGSSSQHRGTDYRAATGTPVKAMHDGTVVQVKVETGPAGNVKGWGQYVAIKGAAGATLYAHLTIGSPTVAIGDVVRTGDVIGLSGNSGIGTGPHLHVEYAPNGKIFDRDSKVNPQPCVGSTVTGSITVNDNGNLADDAFSISIGGQTVCQTQIGASNTCGVGNLRPGTATLTLVAVIAPDDVGTYEITLADGITFSDGSNYRTGTVTEGGSVSFTINIPIP